MEKGRTFEQMLESYFVLMFAIDPDREETEFLRAVGLHELEPFVGRGEKILFGREAFKVGLPESLATMCNLPYTGDFPHLVDGVSSLPYDQMCDIEIPEKLGASGFTYGQVWPRTGRWRHKPPPALLEWPTRATSLQPLHREVR